VRPIPAVLILSAALVGMILFAQGFRVIDSIGMLVCGVAAGASIAAIAAARRKKP
jgi:hypothetical protein